MNRNKYKFTVCLIVSCTASVPFATRAQNSGAADTLYNSGVQAYFRGSTADAETSFSNLMCVDRNDPRPYYFRALSLYQQGREVEARTDMQVGAQLEARTPNRFEIGKTLERVQGPARLMLEGYRRQAYQKVALNPRLGAARSPDTAVLRERRFIPIDEFSRPGEPHSIAAPEPTQETVTPARYVAQPTPSFNSPPAGAVDPFHDDVAASPQPKVQPKAPPRKAAAPETRPAKAPLPPAPKPSAPAPKPAEENNEDPFR